MYKYIFIFIIYYIFNTVATLKYAILGASYGTYPYDIFTDLETASIHSKIFFPEINAVYKSIHLYSDLIKTYNGIPLYDTNNTRYNISYDIFNLDWSNPGQIDYIARYISNNYKFVVSILPPPQLAYLFPLYCKNKCIVVNAFPADKSDYICNNNLPDCIANNIKNKYRRFNNLFTSFRDFSLLCNNIIIMWKNLGISKIGIVYPDNSADTDIYNEIINISNDLYIDIVYVKCVSLSVNMSIYTDFQISELVYNLKYSDLEGLLIIGTSTSLPINYFYIIQQILDKMKNFNYIPKVVSLELGSLDLLKPESIRYFWSTYIWDSRLTGYDFRAIHSNENLEIYSSIKNKYSPAVFLEKFLYNYPEYTYSESSHIVASLATISLLIFQKLIEYSNSIEYNDLILASTIISVPSISGLIQFDRYGRFVTINNDLIIAQIDLVNPKTYKFNLIRPITTDILVFPTPNWNERQYIYNPRTSGLEIGFITLNTFLICVLLYLIHFTVKNRYNVIIKASSPLFLTIFLIGQLCMCIGNYFYTLDSTVAECISFFWFVSIGFDLSFGSLFLKTLRIGQIFNIRRLKISNLGDFKLIKYLSFILLYTIILNTVYSFKLQSELIVSDYNRPAYNYHICFYSENDSIFLILTLVVKFCLFLLGIYTTFNIRNVQTIFNESRYLGISIYGSFICTLIFIIGVFTNSKYNYNLYIFINIWIYIFILNNICNMYYKKLLDYYLEQTYISNYSNESFVKYSKSYSNKIKPLNLQSQEHKILDSSFSPTNINSPFKSPSSDLNFHLGLFKKQ
jgi:hypothetical protein